MNQKKKQKRVQPKKIEESLSYSVEVRDKEGRVLQRISAPSRSFVQQWNQIMNVQAAQANKTITDTGGTPRSIPKFDGNFLTNAAPGITTYGIRVGKGTTGVAIDDFALETPLEEGTGLDEFNHQPVTRTVPAVIGSTCSFNVKRILLNNSGATITGIREIGCYVRMAGGYFGLGFRDVLLGTVTVPDGGSITVTYTIAATV